MNLTLSWRESPIGPLALACDDAGAVRGLSFGDGLIGAMRREYPGAALGEGVAPAAVARGIAAYFDGDREALTRVGWSLDGAGRPLGPATVFRRGSGGRWPRCRPG